MKATAKTVAAKTVAAKEKQMMKTQRNAGTSGCCKGLRPIVALIGAVFLGLTAMNAAGLVLDRGYEADALPTASTPVWTQHFGGAGTSRSVTDGVLTVTTDTAANNLMWRLDGGAGLPWNPTAAGSTLEVRMKVDSQNGTHGAGDITISTGTRIWYVRFLTNGVYEAHVPLANMVAMDTTDGFHTYRFTLAGTSGPLVLYVDDHYAQAGPNWAGGTSTAKRIDFGDTGGVIGGQTQWDYIRWSNDGVAPPALPEPFTQSYEAAALPWASTPVWAEHFLAAGSRRSVTNGVLTVTTDTAANNVMWRLQGGAGLPWNPTAAGSTLEVRMKVDSQNATQCAGDITISTGTRIWFVRFRTNGVAEAHSAYVVAMDTTDGFHTYRFTLAGTSGPLVLYVDGHSTQAAWAGGASVYNRIDFGDTGGVTGGQTQWDYIRLTNAGEFAPPPKGTVISLR